MTEETWLDDDASDAQSAQTTAQAGSLSAAGRRIAIATALPIVGRYFQVSERDNVHFRAIGLTRMPSPRDDPLLMALRFRAALSAAVELVDILEQVVKRPTFRYSMSAAESIGHLSGTLDINRYMTRTTVGGGPTTYPVSEVRRSFATPENALGHFAAWWITEELRIARSAPDVVAGSPEARLARDLTARLKALRARPALAESQPEALALMRGTGLDHLISTVSSRLRRHETANPAPYVDLLAYVQRQHDHGPTGEVGEESWSFYGEHFDARLFELWTLFTLADAISTRLEMPIPRVSSRWRDGAPVFTWSRTMGTLELYFQRSLGTVSKEFEAQWKRTDSDRTLGGIPDIVARVVPRKDGGERSGDRVAIVDPKLRQRGGPPTEELYKILGYFNNFDIVPNPRGAIVFHAPRAQVEQVYSYEREGIDGQLLAVALNPASKSQAKRGIAPVAEMILALLGLTAPSEEEAASVSTDEGERVIEQRLNEMTVTAAHIAPPTLDACRNRLAVSLTHRRWSCLEHEVQTMLATADHVGFTLDSTADFSGPILGLVAAMETVLERHTMGPARNANPAMKQLHLRRTFGQTLAFLKESVDGKQSSAHDALRQAMVTAATGRPPLRMTLDDLTKVNQTYRSPAAHKELMTRGQFNAAYAEIVSVTGPGPRQSRLVGR